MGKRYDRREMEEILRRALAKEEDDAIAHEDLVAAAAEVGVTPEAIEVAAKGLREDRARLVKRTEIMEHARSGFMRHLATYLTVNGGLVMLDFVDGGPFWSQFPLIGWGIMLAMHGVRAFMPNEQRMRRKIDKAMRREERRQRQAKPYSVRDRNQRNRQRAEKVQGIIDDGLDLLLGQVADQLDRQRGGRGSTSAGPRMRVDSPPQGDPQDMDFEELRRRKR